MDRTPLDEALEQAVAQVRDNPGLRDLLEAARAWGVPPSRVLGRRSVDTIVEFDASGRPARYVNPPWDLTDVALALALQRVEAETCDGCGHPLSQTTDPDNEFRYESRKPVRCHACVALAQAAKPFREDDAPQTLRFGVRHRLPVPLEVLAPIGDETPCRTS